MHDAHTRGERMTSAVRDHLVGWRWIGVANAMMLLRGVDFVAAVTLVAELAT